MKKTHEVKPLGIFKKPDMKKVDNRLYGDPAVFT